MSALLMSRRALPLQQRQELQVSSLLRAAVSGRARSSMGSLLPALIPRSEAVSACQALICVPWQSGDTSATEQSMPVLHYESSKQQQQQQGKEAGGWWQNVISKVPKVVGVAVLALALVLTAPGAALARGSGGRVGGRSFSSGGSHSHTSSGMGSSRSSSSSHSMSMGGSRSYNSYSAPPVGPSTVIVGPSYGMPLGGAYGGYQAGMEVAPPPDSGDMDMYAGPNALSIVLLGVIYFAFLTLPDIIGSLSYKSSGDAYNFSSSSTLAPSHGVVSLQVGVLAVADFQGTCAALADSADTSSAFGLKELLRDVCLSLLRISRYCAYGSVSLTPRLRAREAEAQMDTLSIEARSKYDEETRSNYGGKRRKKGGKGMFGSGGSDGPQELVVLTLLVAADDRSGLLQEALGRFVASAPSSTPPALRSVRELEGVLKALAALAPGDLKGVELLWTPEAEGDSLSLDELVADYPTLAPLG